MIKMLYEVLITYFYGSTFRSKNKSKYLLQDYVISFEQFTYRVQYFSLFESIRT